MNGLMLHCGATAQPREALSGILMPQATKTYQPLAHDVFIDMVEDKMRDVGFVFGDQAHSLTKEGKRYFGLVQLLNGNNHEQHALILGIRNSYDKAFSASVAFGSQVFVCDNLAFTGEQVIGRKHTPNIMRDLPQLVTTCVSNTKMMSHVQDQRFETYQEAKLTDAKADRTIINLLRRGAINTSRVEKVVQEWYEPSKDHGNRNRVWNLFNSCTEALKGAPLHDIPRRTIELQAVCDDITSFKPEFAMAA